MEHNCNHFSNDLSVLLTGSEIPKYITDLPNEVLSSYAFVLSFFAVRASLIVCARPGAGRLVPLIDSMFGNIARSIPDKTQATASHASNSTMPTSAQQNATQSSLKKESDTSQKPTTTLPTHSALSASNHQTRATSDPPLPEEDVD